MNKVEASETLGVSLRQVEKLASAGRLGAVDYVRGKRGREARYADKEVARLKRELEAEREQVIGQPPALMRRDSAPLASASADERLLMMAARMAQEMAKHLPALLPATNGAASLLPPAPSVWLTIEQAGAWLGLPRKAIERALHEDRDGDGQQRTIKTLGRGGGLRLHAASIRAHFEE